MAEKMPKIFLPLRSARPSMRGPPATPRLGVHCLTSPSLSAWRTRTARSSSSSNNRRSLSRRRMATWYSDRRLFVSTSSSGSLYLLNIFLMLGACAGAGAYLINEDRDRISSSLRRNACKPTRSSSSNTMHRKFKLGRTFFPNRSRLSGTSPSSSKVGDDFELSPLTQPAGPSRQASEFSKNNIFISGLKVPLDRAAPGTDRRRPARRTHTSRRCARATAPSPPPR